VHMIYPQIQKVETHLIAELRSANGAFSGVARASRRSVAGISMHVAVSTAEDQGDVTRLVLVRKDLQRVAPFRKPQRRCNVRSSHQPHCFFAVSSFK
jgi:hypothetical protein